MPRLKLDIFSTHTDTPEAVPRENMTIAKVPDEVPAKPIRELATDLPEKCDIICINHFHTHPYTRAALVLCKIDSLDIV